MDDEQIKKIIDDTYDESREDTFGSMFRDFYNWRMRSIIIFVWTWGLFVGFVAVYGAVMFFRAEETKPQIMYAALFIAGCQFIALTKIFAWQMIHRNSIKREIKRLELQIAALGEVVKGK